MREFWNRRAREDAYFFVDNRRAYRNPELSGFWAGGERDLDRLLALLGVRIESTDVVLDLGCGVGRLSGDARVHRRARGAAAGLRRLAARAGRGPAGEADPAWLGSAVELTEVHEAAGRGGLELERAVGQGTQFCLVLARKLATTR